MSTAKICAGIVVGAVVLVGAVGLFTLYRGDINADSIMDKYTENNKPTKVGTTTDITDVQHRTVNAYEKAGYIFDEDTGKFIKLRPENIVEPNYNPDDYDNSAWEPDDKDEESAEEVTEEIDWDALLTDPEIMYDENGNIVYYGDDGEIYIYDANTHELITSSKDTKKQSDTDSEEQDSEEQDSEEQESGEQESEEQETSNSSSSKQPSSKEPSENFGQGEGYWQVRIDRSDQSDENVCMKAVTYGDKEYYIETQSAGPWSSYKASSGSSVSKQGCMLYAAAIACSNKTGSLTTVKDIVTELGYPIKYSNGSYQADGATLPCVGYSSGTLTLEMCVNAGGCSAHSVSSQQDVYDAVQDGNMAIVYEKNRSPAVLSGSGSHWYVLAGYEDGKYLVLSSIGSKSGWMDESTVQSSLVGSNHMFIIT